MAANASIRSFHFVKPPRAIGKGGSGKIEVTLEDDTLTSFYVATPDQPQVWADKHKNGYSFGPPVLIVHNLALSSVREALDFMAADMGGYWLRYYNSLRGLSGSAGKGKTSKGRRSKTPAARLEVVKVNLTEVEPPKSPAFGSAALEIILKDSRQFTVLASTPSWFEKRFEEIGAPFYYGSCILFINKLTPASAKLAAAEMAEGDGRWLCTYDTPRTSLPRVMARFMSPKS